MVENQVMICKRRGLRRDIGKLWDDLNHIAAGSGLTVERSKRGTRGRIF
jgi:hypothetical protein